MSTPQSSPPRSNATHATPRQHRGSAPTPQRPIIRKPTLARPDVAAAVAAYMGTTMTEGREALDAVITVLRRLVAAGHRVELRGFGQLRTRWVKPHSAVNPSTRATVLVPGHNVVVMTPSSVFLTGKRGR